MSEKKQTNKELRKLDFEEMLFIKGGRMEKPKKPKSKGMLDKSEF